MFILNVFSLRHHRVFGCLVLLRRIAQAACGKLCTMYQDLILILQSAKILKYFQKFPKYSKISKYVIRFKIAKCRLYRRQISRLRRHFSGFFEIYSKKLRKICEIYSKLEKSQKSFAPNFGKFWKVAKICHILIFWLHLSVFCILIFCLYFVF